MSTRAAWQAARPALGSSSTHRLRASEVPESKHKKKEERGGQEGGWARREGHTLSMTATGHMRDECQLNGADTAARSRAPVMNSSARIRRHAAALRAEGSVAGSCGGGTARPGK